MTDIYFVRHAESFGNLTRRVYGHFDGLVTPKGYLQIEALSKRFCNIHIDRVYSSSSQERLKPQRRYMSRKGLRL
ncbi:MAG: histidine phosphatase family protein [Oscillospiraceae bacterium]|nr:histidine phosphatase family protein [Oscillospiraceae bacterium]